VEPPSREKDMNTRKRRLGTSRQGMENMKPRNRIRNKSHKEEWSMAAQLAH
jgi:hypothetical protein